MASESCPKLCVGCPAVPEGVEAELTALGQPSEDFMRDLKYGNTGLHGSAADSLISSLLIAEFEVTASITHGIDAGDTANLLFKSPNISHEKVRQSIEACVAPTQPGRLQRALGKKAVCNGLPNFEIIPL